MYCTENNNVRIVRDICSIWPQAQEGESAMFPRTSRYLAHCICGVILHDKIQFKLICLNLLYFLYQIMSYELNKKAVFNYTIYNTTYNTE